MWPHYFFGLSIKSIETTYIGGFEADLKSGSGKEYYSYDEDNPELTDLKFEGTWEKDRYSGQGTLYHRSRKIKEKI